MKEINSKEPVRLFKSDFLEFFSHIHPAVVLVVYLPVFGYFVALSIYNSLQGFYPAYFIPAGIIIGAVVWTLTEYLLHRFVFHFTPRGPFQERVSFLFHGVHHAQPMSKTRLVMPPAVSLPLAALFYLLFYGVVAGLLSAPYWVAPLFSGFVAGYILYDMLHYSMHHFQIRRGYIVHIRKNHMLHHGQTPDMRFGVSNTFWDKVFRTNPGD